MERPRPKFTSLVWAIARAHRLSDADAAEVAQLTWLRLVEHIADLKEPGRVGPWPATTARRESLRVLRQTQRSVSRDDGVFDRESPEPRTQQRSADGGARPGRGKLLSAAAARPHAPASTVSS